MSRIYSPVVLFFIAFLMGCSSDTTPDSEEQGRSDKVHLHISVSDPSENSLSPAILYEYSANQGISGEPVAIYTADEFGSIESKIQKNEPVILKIKAAWHHPVQIFIPSTSIDELSVKVIPPPVLKEASLNPAVIGDFNHFDPFDKVQMLMNEDGIWTAKIETDQPVIRYKITGFAHSQAIHGTYGKLVADPELSGIASALEPGADGIVTIVFDPEKFPTELWRTELQFSSDTPDMHRGVAKLFSAMQEQVDRLALYQALGYDVNELFEDYLNHIGQIKDTFDHSIVEQAHRLAKARFSDQISLDPQFIDQLLQDLDPHSQLWLFAPRFVHDLFSNSTKMESVSKNIWDIYRQHNYKEVQSEALYSLINFHYDRGEDEEWHEAHFELVRSFPNSKRINYSYRQGYAPESVVHIGRYFPDLAFDPLIPQSDPILPAEISSSLMIFYFWSFDDPEFQEKFDLLELLNQQFSERGLVIIPIALDEDRSRVQRFHKLRNHPWRAGVERITNPQIQVLGITKTPHIIFLDGNNRVLYHGESILKDDRLPEYVKDFYNIP